MPAPIAQAQAAPRPSLPPAGRVGFEFIGLASALRQQIAQSYATFDAGMARLLEPFEGTNRSPLSRKTLLKRFAADWKALPPFGQLRLKVGTDKGTLAIDEVRCVPSAMYESGWVSSENTLAIVLYSIRIAPRGATAKVLILAMVGQHAIARYFERSLHRGNIALLRALVPIVTAWPRVIKCPGDFSIPVSDGVWRGEATALRLDTERVAILSVRTFVIPS